MKKIGKFIIIISLLSFLLSCGEIEFEPGVDPLELETIDPAQGPEGIVPPDSQPAQNGFPENGGQQEQLWKIEPIPNLDSEQALQICTATLSWGDAERGGCLLLGGTHYYFWITPNEVIKVELNTSDPNQLGFLQAADNRAESIEEFYDDVRATAFAVFGFVLEIPLTYIACATVIGCFLGGSALVGTGYGISEQGDSISEDIIAFDAATIQTSYYYCRIQGNTDQACRVALDMHSPEPGGINE